MVHANQSELLLSSSYDGCVFVHADKAQLTGEYPLLRRINFKEDIRCAGTGHSAQRPVKK